MTAEVIDGRKIARALKAEVALEVDQLNAEGIACALAAVAVGAAGLIRSEHIRAGAVVLDARAQRNRARDRRLAHPQRRDRRPRPRPHATTSPSQHHSGQDVR